MNKILAEIKRLAIKAFPTLMVEEFDWFFGEVEETLNSQLKGEPKCLRTGFVKDGKCASLDCPACHSKRTIDLIWEKYKEQFGPHDTISKDSSMFWNYLLSLNIDNSQPEREGTCSVCKHRNEGDGIHGMHCELHNVACEYEARCDKLDKEGEGE